MENSPSGSGSGVILIVTKNSQNQISYPSRQVVGTFFLKIYDIFAPLILREGVWGLTHKYILL